MPFTVQQVRYVDAQNQQYRTREQWVAARDMILEEQQELQARSTKAERAAARQQKRMLLEDPVTKIHKRRKARMEKRMRMRRRGPGRTHPNAERGRTHRKSHKLAQAT